MSTGTRPPRGPEFVRQLFEEGSRYMDQLLEENERLRLAVVRERDANRAASPEELSRLRRRLDLAVEDAEAARRQHDELRAELDRIEAENREFADICVVLQEKQAALSSLYAASYELHSSLELKDVLETLMEIVINLLGSESFAIYLADEKLPALRVQVDIGMPELAARTLETGHGLVGRAVASDEPWFESEHNDPSEPVVVVPFRVREQTVGALAIFAFLPQKKGITDLDRELFRLVSAQAATALHGARLYQKESRRAATFEGLVDLIRPARRES